MPSKVQWDRDHFTLVYSGAVTLEDSIETYNQVSASQNYDRAMYGLIDCRGIVSVNYTQSDYDYHAAISKAVASHLPKDRLKIGVIAPADVPAGRMLAENVMLTSLEKFPHSWERKLFNTYEDAVDWASCEVG